MEPGEKYPGEFAKWSEEDWLDFRVPEGEESVKIWTYREKVKTGKPRAVIVLNHGLNSHSGSFGLIAQKLAEAGLEAVAMDIRCYGKSKGIKRGQYNSTDTLISDNVKFVERVRDEYPSIPLFVLGASLGGYISLRTSLACPFIAGMILLVPAVQPIPQFFTKPLIKNFFISISGLVSWLPVPEGKATNLWARIEAVYENDINDPLFYRGGLIFGTGQAIVTGMDRLHENLGLVKSPMIVFRAGVEYMVNNEAI